MRRKYVLVIALLIFLAPILALAEEYKTLAPSRSKGSTGQGNISNLTSRSYGFSSQGNTSVLTPNHSGGYIGFDGQGNAVLITPLRGNLGVDSHGNIWTIREK
jgi:hypothetical protein